MKKFLFVAFALAAVLSGCVKDELTNGQDGVADVNAPVFHAGFADASSETKTYVNENGHLRWNADDRLTIFVGKTLNMQYAFDGEDGDNAGGFNPVAGDGGFVTGNPLSANYAVYPYSSSTKISEEGVISLSLPSTQAYGEDSFGRGANTMVAVTQGTDDFYLPFKNVCGYLVVSFYGDATIASISLEGNNGEKLAGAATVTPSFGGNPSLEMKDTATGTITIDCGEGVEIGTTKETATAFWFVVPQTTFSNGITITATSSDGASFQKSTSKTITIERNKFSTMSALEAIFTFGPAIPEIVDLGLPSGIKWASFNIGASRPEENGGYYQWAGLQDVTDTSIYLDDSNCPYHTGTDEHTGWTKYVPSNMSSYWSGPGSPDNKSVLEPEDDVAHVKLGGKWRMPTFEEFVELYDNCDYVWMFQNGVKGIKLISRKNGNTIFLPAAGSRVDENVYNVGSTGYYWSSSLLTGDPAYASGIGFNQTFINYYSSDFVFFVFNRYNGKSIRPVYDDGTGGQAVISVSPEEVEFGTVPLGESAIGSFTISNTGTAAASVSITNPSDVVTSDVSGNITIGAGASKTVTLTFTPKEKGSYGGRILVSCGETDINVLYEGICIEKNNDAPEAVDLGLPSGLKWASCNLGASKPEDYGGYYQWAGLQDVTDTSIYLDWDNCPYHTGSSSSTGWTKYIPSGESSYWSGTGSPDNKTVLDPEDDVVHVKLGGNWRMPTEAEFQELINNCTSEWTTLNGVYGRKFTSKKNGNSIFLPAAGYRDNDNIFYAGSNGFYWSSSLVTDYPVNAYYMYFNSDHVGAYYGYGRYYGQSVRPVCEASGQQSGNINEGFIIDPEQGWN